MATKTKSAVARPSIQPMPTLVQAQSEPDLLRAEIYNFNAEQQANARARLLAMILEPLPEMCTLQLQHVARFVDIAKNDRGSITPAEDFFTSLAVHHYRNGLTPELAIGEIESPDGFRINFDEALDVMNRFSATYPEVLNPVPAEALKPVPAEGA